MYILKLYKSMPYWIVPCFSIIETDEIFSLFVSVALLKFSHNCIDKKFLYYLIYSPIVQMQARVMSTFVCSFLDI